MGLKGFIAFFEKLVLRKKPLSARGEVKDAKKANNFLFQKAI